jgi:Predicted membrane protein
MPDILGHVGLVLIGGVFVHAGIIHFLNFGAVSGMMAAKKLPYPSVLLAAGSILEIAAGICLALDVARPWAAWALIAFTVAASVMLLDFWTREGVERVQMRSAFSVNVAVVGGLLLAAVG